MYPGRNNIIHSGVVLARVRGRFDWGRFDQDKAYPVKTTPVKTTPNPGQNDPRMYNIISTRVHRCNPGLKQPVSWIRVRLVIYIFWVSFFIFITILTLQAAGGWNLPLIVCIFSMRISLYQEPSYLLTFSTKMFHSTWKHNSR